MPNRYIREDAIESESVNSVSWQAEVFWRRLLNRADDFGRFTANPALLRSLIFPLQLDRVRDSDIPRLLTECEKAGLLFVYAADNKQILVLNKWERGRAKQSKYPEPPTEVIDRMKTFVYRRIHMSANVPDSDTDSDTDPDCDADIAAAGSTTMSDAEWLALLCKDPTYTGIDVQRERGKMLTWCSVNNKKPTRRRFVNWLNRIEQPLVGAIQCEFSKAF